MNISRPPLYRLCVCFVFFSVEGKRRATATFTLLISSFFRFLISFIHLLFSFFSPLSFHTLDFIVLIENKNLSPLLLRLFPTC